MGGGGDGMTDTFEELKNYGNGPVAIFSYVGGTFAIDRKNLLIRIENKKKRSADMSEEIRALDAIDWYIKFNRYHTEGL